MIIESLKAYGDYYNISRALPSIVDGLKPSQRKLLYTATKINIKGDKMVTFIGEAMKHSVHGDTSLIGASFRMMQPWRSTYPLFTSDGNIGSQAGLGAPDSGAAAPRYLTISLSPLGKLYGEFHKRGLNPMVENDFTGLPEPETMYVPVPAFLLYNQLGIGVGVATDFPSFTLSSVIDYTVQLLQNPNAQPNLVPVFHSGCEIVNKSDLPEIYKGNKSLRLRAKYTQKGDTLEISNFPPTTCPTNVIDEIEKAKEKILIFDNILDMHDISTVTKGKTDIRLKLKLKKATHIEALIRTLNLETSCETTVPMNLTLLGADNKPHKYSVQSALLEWIDIAYDKTTKQFTDELADLAHKKEILDGLIKALDDIDEIIALIKASASKSDAREQLVKRGYTTDQSNAILDMRLHKLANLEYQELLADLQKVAARKLEVEKILTDRSSMTAYIINNMQTFKKFEIYATGCPMSDSVTTRVKKIETHTVKVVKDKLVIDKGGVDIKECVAIVNNVAQSINIEDNGLKVDALLCKADSGKLIVTVSKDNRIKCTAVSEVLGSRKATYTKQEDLVGVFVCDKDSNVAIKTNQGKISFSVAEVPLSGKGALGVKAIKLKKDEVIVSASIADVAKHTRYTQTRKR